MALLLSAGCAGCRSGYSQLGSYEKERLGTARIVPAAQDLVEVVRQQTVGVHLDALYAHAERRDGFDGARVGYIPRSRIWSPRLQRSEDPHSSAEVFPRRAAFQSEYGGL